MSELPEASGNARWLSSQCLHCIVGVRSARIGAKSAPHLARKAGVLDFRKRMRERDGLSAGGSRIRTLGPRSLLEARATAGSYGGSVAAKELRPSCFQNCTTHDRAFTPTFRLSVARAYFTSHFGGPYPEAVSTAPLLCCNSSIISRVVSPPSAAAPPEYPCRCRRVVGCGGPNPEAISTATPLCCNSSTMSRVVSPPSVAALPKCCRQCRGPTLASDRPNAAQCLPVSSW